MQLHKIAISDNQDISFIERRKVELKLELKISKQLLVPNANTVLGVDADKRKSWRKRFLELPTYKFQGAWIKGKLEINVREAATHSDLL